MPATDACPSCPACEKDFASGRALRQHVLDKHGLHACLGCLKWFGSTRALEVHDCGRPSIEDLTPPFRSAVGSWVPLAKSTVAKSFGVFWCPTCKKRWFSAHAHRVEPNQQQCEDCLAYHPPVFMWVNETKSESKSTRRVSKGYSEGHSNRYSDSHSDKCSDGFSNESVERREKKPHKAGLCQRCQSGLRCTKA